MTTIRAEAVKLEIMSFKMASGCEVIAAVKRNEATESCIVVEMPLQLVLDRTSNTVDQYLLRDWATHAVDGVVVLIRSNIEAFFKCDDDLKEMYLNTVILIAQRHMREKIDEPLVSSPSSSIH